MTSAQEKLTARIASLTTEQIIEVSLRMNLATTQDQTIVAIYAERELEKRMTPADFVAHMDVLEAMLDAAA